ncbi:hypothetical protein A5880_001667 [Enterococcus sp. 4G2_DIV0659]|uniref:Thioredoxin domain-containing protein n=2 Tax=Candidatus Enterococcus mansonii TaxID=1834181 RepID=A0A242CEC1_9ENTE|nr:thioredoxin family protein [Enterococcus sp. 4G2_DIV0659]OTO08587.1 hypothetical protein A5880_001587 [Enterococcus sp. 4G2_DIV0659]
MLIGLCATIFYIYLLKKQVEVKVNELNIEKEQYPEIYNALNSVTFSSFGKKIKDGESLVVYIGRPSCSDCTTFEPELIKMINEKKLNDRVLYLNVSELKKDKGLWAKYVENYELPYTPTLAAFREGKVENQVSWTPEKGSDLKAFENFLDAL